MFTKSSLFVYAAIVVGRFQASTAIDYLGGWLPTPAKQQCVDICVNSKATPTCPTNDPDCLSKKQQPFDYDYLLLEQLFVPQFCRDLLTGTDSTISHQNVLPYPNGITCKPEVVKSEMTIHGLWPNYNAGYIGCCNVTESIGNHPYNALEFSKNQPTLLAEMKEKWVDPTQSNEYDSLCEIYNHEFQKHGLCYGAQGDDYEAAAVTYFKATLGAADAVGSATTQLNAWAAESQEAPSKEAIEALFPNQIQVLCSNVDGKNQLSAIRSCFAKMPSQVAVGPYNPIDCAPAAKTSAFIPCESSVPIKLLPYSPPQ